MISLVHASVSFANLFTLPKVMYLCMLIAQNWKALPKAYKHYSP